MDAALNIDDIKTDPVSLRKLHETPQEMPVPLPAASNPLSGLPTTASTASLEANQRALHASPAGKSVRDHAKSERMSHIESKYKQLYEKTYKVQQNPSQGSTNMLQVMDAAMDWSKKKPDRKMPFGLDEPAMFEDLKKRAGAYLTETNLPAWRDVQAAKSPRSRASSSSSPRRRRGASSSASSIASINERNR